MRTQKGRGLMAGRGGGGGWPDLAESAAAAALRHRAGKGGTIRPRCWWGRAGGRGGARPQRLWSPSREPSVKGRTQRFRPKRRCSRLQTPRARAYGEGGVSGRGTLNVSRFLRAGWTCWPALLSSKEDEEGERVGSEKMGRRRTPLGQEGFGKGGQASNIPRIISPPLLLYMVGFPLISCKQEPLRLEKKI